MENEIKKPNLKEKMHAIMTDVSYIQKDKTNTFHKYNYASEAVIKEQIHKALVDKRILFNLEVKDVTNHQIVNETGKTSNLLYAKMHYSFLDIDSEEKIEGDFYGSGEDKLDKALYKAITGGIKYIMTSTFVIPTGDDPEASDPTQDKVKPVPFAVKTMEVVKPLGNNVMTCDDCGFTMNYKEGISASGKAYKGYFCPNAKKGLDGHRPMFIND